MSLPVANNSKQSQPFSGSAIVIFVLLLVWTLAVLYGCLKNASYLSYSVLREQGITLPFFSVVLFLNLLTLATGLYFLVKRKIVRANVFLFGGNLLIYLAFFIVSH